MSAATLREAAALIREEQAVDDEAVTCACGDSDDWFDRSICAEPCGSMHYVCTECGRIKGRCPNAEMGRVNGNRLGASWLAVAEWFDSTARYLERGKLPLSRDLHAIRTARTYLATTDPNTTSR